MSLESSSSPAVATNDISDLSIGQLDDILAKLDHIQNSARSAYLSIARDLGVPEEIATQNLRPSAGDSKKRPAESTPPVESDAATKKRRTEDASKDDEEEKCDSADDDEETENEDDEETESEDDSWYYERSERRAREWARCTGAEFW